MKDKSVRIIDWAGNILCINAYDSEEIEQVLDANRCKTCDDHEDDCPDCNGTGYSGEISAEWIDGQNYLDDMNVYEYIPY